MKFEIDECYLTSINIKKEWSIYAGLKELTDDQLVKVLKGEDRCCTIRSGDHPEFAKLREQLGVDGYIKIQRGWWNGDEVIKPFTLNGAKFKKGEQFPCASAMSGHLKFTKKLIKNTKPKIAPMLP